MTREEIIQAIFDDKMMPFIQPEQLSQIVEFVIKNYRPFLPEDLDEAAVSYSESDEPLYSPGHRFYWDNESLFGKQIETAFKAGAEWMAGQGICADAKICKLAGRAWVTPINEKQFQRDVYDNFTVDDEVIVQIRKK